MLIFFLGGGGLKQRKTHLKPLSSRLKILQTTPKHSETQSETTFNHLLSGFRLVSDRLISDIMSDFWTLAWDTYFVWSRLAGGWSLTDGRGLVALTNCHGDNVA